jgi:hypothetical protein
VHAYLVSAASARRLLSQLIPVRADLPQSFNSQSLRGTYALYCAPAPAQIPENQLHASERYVVVRPAAALAVRPMPDPCAVLQGTAQLRHRGLV